MAIATITSVNLPAHQYPHVEVNINDNTLRRYTQPTVEYGKTLCVFRSPKGPDGVYTVNGYEQFVDTYGEGSVAEYGQPLLNARTLASGNNITMHCLRVTASDATVSNIHVFARYRVKPYMSNAITDTVTVDATVTSIVYNEETKAVTSANIYATPDGVQYINLKDAELADTDTYMGFTKTTDQETGAATLTVTTAVTPTRGFVPGMMSVYFVAKNDAELNKADQLVEKDKYSSELINKLTITSSGTWGSDQYAETYTLTEDAEYAIVDPTPAEEGVWGDWHEIRLFSIAALGRGRCGNDISFNITTDPNRDKSNSYKNYFVQVFEGSTLIEKFAVTLTSNGIVRGETKFIENTINDDDFSGNGSSVIRMNFNEDAVKILYKEFDTRVNPGYITYDAFDPILNIDKRKVANRKATGDKSMDGYYICTTAISPTKNPDDEEYETEAAYTADYDSGYYFKLSTIEEQANVDNCAQFDFNAIVGSPLTGGNDGAFALVTNGGTSTSNDKIKAAVDAAYQAIFEGVRTERKSLYKNITTLGITDNSGVVTEYKVKNVTLYFDENNNYLINLNEDDGDSILDCLVDQTQKATVAAALNGTATNAYVIVDKMSTKIVVPKKKDRVYYDAPDSATAEYPYPEIRSKNKTEIDFFLDANYSYDTKVAICNWVNTDRPEQFVVYLDAGTSETLVSKSDAYTWVQAFDEVTNGNENKRYWYFSIDAYYGKIRDPYNYKIVEVTSTYNLARNLVAHWQANGGKHIPYAGSLYAVIDSYLPKSVFPIMDEGLDSEHMDRFIEEHVNYAQVNSRGDMIRATQSTRYPILGDAFTLSNLTELNNVHVVLDIKKDVEHVLELFAYQFNETSDLRKFNTIVSSSILPKYSAAQVKSISAQFDRTSEEAEYGILHLYIEVVHKNLVKIVMVDIDVNRNTD
jgi:hypothetical protein